MLGVSHEESRDRCLLVIWLVLIVLVAKIFRRVIGRVRLGGGELVPTARPRDSHPIIRFLMTKYES